MQARNYCLSLLTSKRQFSLFPALGCMQDYMCIGCTTFGGATVCAVHYIMLSVTYSYSLEYSLVFQRVLESPILALVSPQRIMLEKVADSARKAVKLAEPYKPYGGQFLEFCSISLSTYQTCMKLTRKSTEFCQFFCRHYPHMPISQRGRTIVRECRGVGHATVTTVLTVPLLPLGTP